jgi:nucleoside-diphosphate-sugar epimerase
MVEAGPPRVLVTGASGFIGRELAKRLRASGQLVRGTRRSQHADAIPEPIEWCNVGEIGPGTEWREALQNVRAIVHAAGRAHLPERSARDADLAFEVNTHGTLRLAHCAAQAGVKHLVFLSSIGVIGDATRGQPFDESTPLNPQGAYARSKLEAEIGIREIATRTGMNFTIVRPPLVYGPHAPGNFGRLVRLVRRGLPLPLGAVRNQRSMIAVENLADLLARCIENPSAVNETFVVADGTDVSTPELARLIAQGLGTRISLLPVPPRMLRAAARLAGQLDAVDKLCQSLQIDNHKLVAHLHWQPLVTPSEAIPAAARASQAAA